MWLKANKNRNFSMVPEGSRNSWKRKQKGQSSGYDDSESRDNDVTLSPTMSITFNIGEYIWLICRNSLVLDTIM